MNDQNLTAAQLERLARGAHNTAAYYEEEAHNFPRSKAGYMKQASLYREEAHKLEEQAKAKNKI